MKKLVAVLLLVLMPASCANFETTKHKQARLENIAWTEMCGLLAEETDYRCMRLIEPLVVYQKMREGLQGYYKGGDTIYVNSDLSGDKLLDVLMHEGIHYVHTQHMFIKVPGPAIDVCWSENEAWTLTGIYYGVDNSRWWRAYPHCWQWYANDQYLRDLGGLYNEISEIIDGIIIED